MNEMMDNTRWVAQFMSEELNQMVDEPQSHPQELFLLTGSYDEFKYYEKEYRHDFRVRYLSNKEQLYGRRRGVFLCVGSWFTRRDIVDIIATLKHLEFHDISSRLPKTHNDWHFFEGHVSDMHFGDVIPKEDFLSEEEMKI